MSGNTKMTVMDVFYILANRLSYSTKTVTPSSTTSVMPTSKVIQNFVIHKLDKYDDDEDAFRYKHEKFHQKERHRKKEHKKKKQALGFGNNPGSQKGDASSTRHQVSDPNASSGSTSTSSEQAPSETQIEQILQGESVYHKIITALSIVGSIAGFSIIVGAFIFARSQMRKRKRKLDIEMASRHKAPSSPSSPSSPTPPVTSSQHRSSSHFSNTSDDDATIVELKQNPFVDQDLAIRPPSLPRPTYGGYRQNRTLSMISQTTALPSAPSAKELDMMYDTNPFEGQQQSYPVTEDNEDNEEDNNNNNNNNQLETATATATATTTTTTTTTTNYVAPSTNRCKRKSQRFISSALPVHEEEKPHEYATELPPPPAYTPSVIPSAPPLYALPTTAGPLEEEEDNDDVSLSRRHSISYCSIISSTTRPLSLRRGSGSLAHTSIHLT
ncbi:uncharacterized protein BX663DRAFT_483851 [Cokeromyces recurvatus]|uniref:uncharacterized protein n=1 Tax=Cokeromyces recurvatus TaxID=90255 RepID=UPI00221E82CA|nr:uncharacterized protein BX663DRAFT_483851 [Cokeromyces recurvatus]KAI7906234.1 hypothetical protein BX663DRAFT_483851 [Cokeromyces recurvatus]